MADAESTDKLSYFQAVTGLSDADLCAEILAAHNWDLELAISSITAQSSSSAASSSSPSDRLIEPPRPADPAPAPAPPGLAWKLITLPFYIASGTLSLGFWIAGGVLSRSLHLLGLTPPSPSPSRSESAAFIAAFHRDYPAAAAARPDWVELGFMEALQLAQREFKLLFVYLHSPEHPDTPDFCGGCLCSEAVAAFVNQNFVCWGGSVRETEGYKMSNSLKASRFPFCAVVAAASNQQIVLIQQIEGPVSSDRMLRILNQVIEESTPTLVSARMEAEERATNIRLREEQDAAYRAALEADQARERQRREEQERLEREAAEAERKLKEEAEAAERAAREAAEKEAALARRRQEKAMSLGTEPEKGPDVTQIEGPVSSDRMLRMSTPTLVSARMEAEERATNIRLREEQDAAYRAALEADQARERQRREDQERLEREAAEAARKLEEEAEAQERAAREAAEKDAALARRWQEKAMSLGTETEKGPDVTRVVWTPGFTKLVEELSWQIQSLLHQDLVGDPTVKGEQCVRGWEWGGDRQLISLDAQIFS